MTAMISRQEAELKLQSGREAFDALVNLLQAQHGYAIGSTQQQRFTDEYYDSRDWWLYQAGAALRVRRFDHEAVLTLKSIHPNRRGILRRVEWEERLEVRNDNPHGLPVSGITKVLAASGAPAVLRPLFRIKTARSLLHCVKEPQCLVLCYDHSALYGPDTSERAPAVDQFEEVEIEHAGGSLQDTEGLLKHISAHKELPVSTATKFERALTRLHLTPPRSAVIKPAVVRPASLKQAAADLIAAYGQQIQHYEPGARLGLDPEYLHQLRVALRRLRTVFQVFRRAFKQDFLKSMEQELAWLGRHCSQVRDWDIFFEYVEDYFGAHALLAGPVLGRFNQRAAEQRDRARHRLLTAVNSKRYKNLMHSLERFSAVADEYRLAEWEVEDSGAIEPPLAQRLVRRLVKRGDRAMRSPRATRLHKVRLACKALRYFSEWSMEPAASKGPPWVKQLTRLQGRLGAYQDSIRFVEQVQSTVHHMQPEEIDSAFFAMNLGRMLERHRQAQRSLEKKFPKQWMRLRKKLLNAADDR
jgi:inorganic triphosphatase YgiF